jgi:hypothetical protein
MKRYIVLPGQIAYEQTTNLSKTDYMMTISIHFLSPPPATGYVQSINLTTLLNCINHEVRGYILPSMISAASFIACDVQLKCITLIFNISVALFVRLRLKCDVPMNRIHGELSHI